MNYDIIVSHKKQGFSLSLENPSLKSTLTGVKLAPQLFKG